MRDIHVPPDCPNDRARHHSQPAQELELALMGLKCQFGLTPGGPGPVQSGSPTTGLLILFETE